MHLVNYGSPCSDIYIYCALACVSCLMRFYFVMAIHTSRIIDSVIQVGQYPRHVISLFFRLLYPWYWPSSCWNFIVSCIKALLYSMLAFIFSTWESLRRPKNPWMVVSSYLKTGTGASSIGPIICFYGVFAVMLLDPAPSLYGNFFFKKTFFPNQCPQEINVPVWWLGPDFIAYCVYSSDTKYGPFIYLFICIVCI